jgi:muconate cycloisomerase
MTTKIEDADVNAGPPPALRAGSRRAFLGQALAGVVAAAGCSQGGGGASVPVTSPSTASPIRVDRIETFKVVVPMRPGVVNSEELGALIDPALATFDQVPKFLIRIHADNGHIGVGETGRGDHAATVAENAAFLTGKNLLELNLADDTLGLPQRATADAFEIAIYDLLGKSWGLPVHQLLGGRQQDKVAVTYWTGQRTNDDLVAVAELAVEKGFKRLKFKGRLKDPIIERVRAVRKATPTLGLTVDFNSSYPGVAEFLPVARAMQEMDVMVEDPFPKNPAWFKELRDKTKVQLALTPGGVPAMMEAIRLQACEVFNLGGNMRHFVRVCHLAEAAGIEVWHGSGVELGVRDMSFLQAAAATRSCTVPSDTLSFFLRSSDLLTQPVEVVDGFVTIPRTPGLGVELDMDKVRHYEVA